MAKRVLLALLVGAAFMQTPIAAFAQSTQLRTTDDAINRNIAQALERLQAQRIRTAMFTPATFEGRKPVAIIRFDKPDLAFQPALRTAVERAVARNPKAQFDLVAIAPESGDPAAALTDAGRVMESMGSMGVGADRVVVGALTGPTAPTPEVHVYLH